MLCRYMYHEHNPIPQSVMYKHVSVSFLSHLCHGVIIILITLNIRTALYGMPFVTDVK